MYNPTHVSFVSKRTNTILGLVFHIYYDSNMGIYQVQSLSGTILFTSESHKSAILGVRNYHNRDICGLRVGENGGVYNPMDKDKTILFTL